MKSSSQLALVAAAGLFVGGVAMPSAKAADLGGDCCADLEERVAELEATTARKGNRKMSLTVTGQVNRIVTWYDDSKTSTAYYGLDNTNSSSRFIFNGSAKVTPKVSMGFEIMIEIEAGGTSSKVSQFDEDGKLASFIGNVNIPGGAVGVPSFNAHNTDAYFGDARRAAWWIEHEDLGRLTVGRYDAAGVYATVDISGGDISLPASNSFILLNGGYFLRGPTGQVYTMTWSSIGDPASASSGRTEGVRYDSPDWHGFIYAATIGEAGDYWTTHLRYAGEFNGFRLAGVLGYERVTDIASPAIIDPANAAYTGAKPNITVWGIALSAKHVPTGLFVQGHYNAADYGGKDIGAASGYWGESTVNKKPTEQWMIQAGWSKNVFGYGNTTAYGEYGVATDWGADITCGSTGSQCGGSTAGATGANAIGRNYAAPSNTSGFTAVSGVTSSEMTMWGLGVTQVFDAAATTVYLGYRHFDADVKCTDKVGAGTCTGGVAAGGAFTINKLA
ncbi:MAG TPA: hypothetical protein VLL28_03180, partial [Hyphomicrobiaceae bacterium]|nr:hypothetical protein [Hyphomicrobiaceae bacterium]